MNNTHQNQPVSDPSVGDLSQDQNAQPQPQVNQSQNWSDQGDVGQSQQVSDPVVAPPENQPNVEDHKPIEPPAGSGFDKEHGPMVPAHHESVPMVEVESSAEIPPEVQEYVEKTDHRNMELQKPVVHHGKPIVESAAPSGQPQIVLPLTHQGVVTGLKAGVGKSVMWLATWCVRVIKKFRGRVVYSSSKHTEEK